MCKDCKKKLNRVSGVSSWDTNELAVMAAGGLAAKALVNPLGKALFKNSKPKYTPLIIKAGLTFAMSMIDDQNAQTAAKGAALATILEAADILAPKVFDPTGFAYLPQEPTTNGVGEIEMYYDGSEYDEAQVLGVEDVL